jgi:hypothetical protein
MADRRERAQRAGGFWPFGTRAAVLSVPVLLAVLLAVTVLLRQEAADASVLAPQPRPTPSPCATTSTWRR